MIPTNTYEGCQQYSMKYSNCYPTTGNIVLNGPNSSVNFISCNPSTYKSQPAYPYLSLPNIWINQDPKQFIPVNSQPSQNNESSVNSIKVNILPDLKFPTSTKNFRDSLKKYDQFTDQQTFQKVYHSTEINSKFQKYIILNENKFCKTSTSEDTRFKTVAIMGCTEIQNVISNDKFSASPDLVNFCSCIRNRLVNPHMSTHKDLILKDLIYAFLHLSSSWIYITSLLKLNGTNYIDWSALKILEEKFHPWEETSADILECIKYIFDSCLNNWKDDFEGKETKSFMLPLFSESGYTVSNGKEEFEYSTNVFHKKSNEFQYRTRNNYSTNLNSNEIPPRPSLSSDAKDLNLLKDKIDLKNTFKLTSDCNAPAISVTNFSGAADQDLQEINLKEKFKTLVNEKFSEENQIKSIQSQDEIRQKLLDIFSTVQSVDLNSYGYLNLQEDEMGNISKLVLSPISELCSSIYRNCYVSLSDVLSEVSIIFVQAKQQLSAQQGANKVVEEIESLLSKLIRQEFPK